MKGVALVVRGVPGASPLRQDSGLLGQVGWEGLGSPSLFPGLELQMVGTSLAVQWLRLRFPMQGVWVPSLVGELGCHMPHGQKTET